MADKADKVLAMVDNLEAEIAKEEEEAKAAKAAKDAKEAKEKEIKEKEAKEKEAKKKEATGKEEEAKNKEVKRKEAVERDAKEKEAKEQNVGKEQKTKKTPSRRNSSSLTPKQPPKPAARKRKCQEIEAKADTKKTKVNDLEPEASTPLCKAEDKAFVFTDTMLELFLETGNDEEFFTSTQVNPEKVTITKVVDNDNSDAMEEDEEANGNDTVIETKNRNEKELEVKIEELAKAVKEKNIEIATMRSNIEEKEKAWLDREMMSQGTISSLEEEKKELETKLTKFNEAMMMMVEKNRKLRLETNNKQSEINSNATADDMKKNLKDAEEKLEKMTLEKSYFETEAKRNSRVIDNLSTLLQLERESVGTVTHKGATASGDSTTTGAAMATTTAASMASTTAAAMDSTTAASTGALRFPVKKCFKFEQGQCKIRNCSFLHPTTACPEFSRSGVCRDRECLDMHVGEHKGDCWFWRMGSCRFNENECGRGLHRPEMLESINGGRKEKEAGARRDQGVTTPIGAPSPAPFVNTAPFFESGSGNQLAELLRTMTTPATEPARMVTNPGVSHFK